jgi:hypothetical protein
MVNLNVRQLSDSSVFFTFEYRGKRYEGSSRNWDAFVDWLAKAIHDPESILPTPSKG